ncbi:hypothetical protein [Natrinema sp. 1APR25-10V2]|uniref:hypothetical protein n=1 Tax=Natrinema sp. 1APR25-10V2 TaxID=2951081 RepID=UPI00287605DF|nr:hypothetical protein [Natrinema sp. 1APR25-10V2]MDS0475113.1 hypothetical protein [Natrinema sp. 1APR25-10V2]
MTTAATDYDVIEVNAGDTFRKTLSRGETWENVLIDITARGASYRITATTDDWTIRNVGIRGELDSTPGSQNFVVQVASSGATGVIENVYLPGTAYARSTSPFPSGIYVHFNHAGDLEIKNLYVENMPSHGVYGSDPGNRSNDGNGGTVRIHDSYAADLENSGFRIGTDGSYVDNCVSFRTVRGLWSRWANTEARGCDFGDNSTDIVVGQSGYSRSSTVTLDGTTCFGTVYEANGSLTGNSAGTPQERIPVGCPKTAVEAASGTAASDSSSSSDGGTDLPENTLTVTGTGEPTEYYVETTDELVADPDAGSLESHDSIDATSATGWVTNTSHVDGYRFAGDLHEVAFRQGSAHVEVNGEPIDPDQYNGDQPTLENTLLVDGVGTSGGTRYEFAVSGAAEKATVKGATIDSEDTVDGGTITGSVAGWRDGFNFSGELTDLTLDGDARVYVNGEQVDPADYGDEQPHVLTLVGNGSSASYEITVDGTIETVDGDAAEDHATVLSDTTVEGSIERDAQRFRFSGALTDVTFHDGSAHVYLDDQRIDPADYDGQERLPHAIVIDGSGTDGQSSYSFAVDGEVVTASYRDASVDPGDAVEGTAVSGSVDDELDAYWFDGSITDFRLNGDASVDVQYNVQN